MKEPTADEPPGKATVVIVTAENAVVAKPAMSDETRR